MLTLDELWDFLYYEIDQRKLIERKLKEYDQQVEGELSDSDKEISASKSKDRCQ